VRCIKALGVYMHIVCVRLSFLFTICLQKRERLTRRRNSYAPAWYTIWHLPEIAVQWRLYVSFAERISRCTFLDMLSNRCIRASSIIQPPRRGKKSFDRFPDSRSFLMPWVPRKAIVKIVRRIRPRSLRGNDLSHLSMSIALDIINELKGFFD